MINLVKCQEENYPVEDWFKCIYHLKPMKIIKLINCRLLKHMINFMYINCGWFKADFCSSIIITSSSAFYVKVFRRISFVLSILNHFIHTHHEYAPSQQQDELLSILSFPHPLFRYLVTEHKGSDYSHMTSLTGFGIFISSLLFAVFQTWLFHTCRQLDVISYSWARVTKAFMPRH